MIKWKPVSKECSITTIKALDYNNFIISDYDRDDDIVFVHDNEDDYIIFMLIGDDDKDYKLQVRAIGSFLSFLLLLLLLLLLFFFFFFFFVNK